MSIKKRRRFYYIAWGLALLGVAYSRQAAAQSVKSQPTDEVRTDAFSPGEQAAILKALTADSAVGPSPVGGASTRQTATIPKAGASAPGAVAGLQNMNPDISVLLDTAVSAFNVREPIELGEHDPTHTGFTLQQLELHMGANVDPYLRLDSNLVFLGAGVEIEEAFATSLGLPFGLQLRAGQFLSRFGRINSMHPHQWNFLDQPLVLGKFFGPDGQRGLGVELSWLSPLPWYLEVVYSGTNLQGGCCSRSYMRRAPDAALVLHDLLSTLAVKQYFALARDVGLLWGVSAQTGPVAAEGRTAIVGTDLYLRWRPLVSDVRQSVGIKIEAMWRQRQRGANHATLRDVGGFIEGVYNLSPQWETALRAEAVTGVAGESGPEIAAPPSVAQSGDPLDPQWTSTRTRYAAAVTYLPTHFSRVRLQGTYSDAAWLSRPIFGLMLGLEVVVGAHGAHMY